MTDLYQLIEQVEPLLSQMTPGPWKFERHYSGSMCVSCAPDGTKIHRSFVQHARISFDFCERLGVSSLHAQPDQQEYADLKFIAAARELLPALIDERRRMLAAAKGQPYLLANPDAIPFYPQMTDDDRRKIDRQRSLACHVKLLELLDQTGALIEVGLNGFQEIGDWCKTGEWFQVTDRVNCLVAKWCKGPNPFSVEGYWHTSPVGLGGIVPFDPSHARRLTKERGLV